MSFKKECVRRNEGSRRRSNQKDGKKQDVCGTKAMAFKREGGKEGRGKRVASHYVTER